MYMLDRFGLCQGDTFAYSVRQMIILHIINSDSYNQHARWIVSACFGESLRTFACCAAKPCCPVNSKNSTPNDLSLIHI